MALTIVHGPNILRLLSLSDVLDCSAAAPVRISMPAAWTAPAVLTFQVSSDNVTFEDLFDATGHEFMVNVIPGTVVRLSSAWAVAPLFLKFRSGTRAAPVAQTANRTFTCALA